MTKDLLGLDAGALVEAAELVARAADAAETLAAMSVPDLLAKLPPQRQPRITYRG